jgi:hypothetical protein
MLFAADATLRLGGRDSRLAQEAFFVACPPRLASLQPT